MRQITRDAINAFLSGETFSRDNTQVTRGGLDGETITLLLHGNRIAVRCLHRLNISNAGWFSNTTKERLNGLPGVSINQKAGVWYLNGQEWSGEWTEV